MKAIKILSILMTAAICTMAFTACGKDQADPAPNESQLQSSQETSSIEEVKPIINPFTGETGYSEELLRVRPVAVMINNISAALPQSGIADADILYEMPVEGAVTRMMAVFSDYQSIPNIGSIRSARHDYVELVKPLNALYLHFGGSDAGKKAIANNKVDAIDGIAMANTAFYMDKERAKTKSSDHCWFSNGELLQKGIAKKGFDMKTEPLAPLFQFASPEEDAMADILSAKAAAEISFPISGSSKASFSYDAATKLYSKSQNGKPHLDTNKNAAVQSKNIFLMYTEVGFMADDYHKEIEMSRGSGYYISNGKSIEVTFKKAAVGDTIKVYGADGTEIKVNAGKSYFCVIPNSQREKLVIS